MIKQCVFPKKKADSITLRPTLDFHRFQAFRVNLKCWQLTLLSLTLNVQQTYEWEIIRRIQRNEFFASGYGFINMSINWYTGEFALKECIKNIFAWLLALRLNRIFLAGFHKSNIIERHLILKFNEFPILFAAISEFYTKYQ